MEKTKLPLKKQPRRQVRGGATKSRDQKDNKRIKHGAPGMSLPSRADRQKILEHATLVLAEARAVAEKSDRALAILSGGHSKIRPAAA